MMVAALVRAATAMAKVVATAHQAVAVLRHHPMTTMQRCWPR